jgi:formamidopyrimidine-DNA glycosylase
MPELPEVETVVRDLQPRLTGRRFDAVRAGPRSLRKPWLAEWGDALVGRHVAAVTRRGKWAVAELSNGARLVIHLGMTGQLTVAESDAPPRDHTHLVFTLDDGRELRFRDIRRFGSATLFATPEELAAFFESSGLGPEPFGLDARYWRRRLAGADRCLKAVLLDQRVVAGVGNIYADESLFEARLHPARRARDLGPAAANRLRQAVECRGSSIRNYVGGSGLNGDYQNEFRAYGRTGAPCLRCRTPLVRVRLAGRSTHFCPRCQPEGGRAGA